MLLPLNIMTLFVFVTYSSLSHLSSARPPAAPMESAPHPQLCGIERRVAKSPQQPESSLRRHRQILKIHTAQSAADACAENCLKIARRRREQPSRCWW